MSCPIAVVCSLLLLSLDHVWSEELCPLVLEGSAYTLPCTGSMSRSRLPTDSFINWIERNSSSGGDIDITLCDLRTACETNRQGEYSVNNTIAAESFTSLLRFNVTDRHRDKTLVCKLWSSKTTVRSCRMAVFKHGSKTDCTANLNNDGKIELLCFSHDVYPGISCQYSEYINSVPTNVNQAMTKIRQKINGRNLYHSKCEMSVFPLVKGSYEYHFKVVPDYQVQGHWTFTSERSLKVINSPKVEIDQVETPSLCPGKSSVRVVCSVDDWFGAKPLFRFNLLNKTLDSVETSQSGYKYKMTYDVPMKESYYKALMNCTVGYNDSGGTFRGVWDTKQLNFLYPPKTPVFTNTALPTLSQILDITQGQNMTIECQALGGFPLVSFMNVTCMSKGRVIYMNVTNSNRLPVMVYGNDTYNGAFCVCQAKHKTPCYNGDGGIVFRVRQIGQKRDAHSSDTLNKMTPVYYIIIAVLILIFLPIIIGTCVFIRKHGAKLYEYYYALYRRHTPGSYNRGGTTRLTLPPAPPLPPPRVPPRPSGYLLAKTTEAESQPLDVRAQGPSNEEGWMEDNEPVPSQCPAVAPRTQHKRTKRRKKRRKVHATPSDTSVDYLIPFPRRSETTVSDPTDVSLTQANNSDYLSMNYMTEHCGEASLGFAPLAPLPMNNIKGHLAPFCSIENTDTENTGANSVTCEPEETQRKSVCARRHSPSRYVKLDGKGKKRRETGREASSGAAGGICEDLGQQASESVWVDTSMSDVELGFNGDSDGSDQPGSRKDFLLPQDGGYVSSDPNTDRVLGPSSLMIRAVREQNVYVDDSIY